MEVYIKMEEDPRILRIYCDKQKKLIADLIAEKLVLETRLEIADLANKSSASFMNEQEEKNINKEETTKKPVSGFQRRGQLK